jgi:O-antigen/teichoic acid export membrane protein
LKFGNILWNLLGLGLPLLIAAITVPEQIIQIGLERFGLLALAWALIGYAGALDFGVGRAATQRISALKSAGHHTSIIHVVATAVRITQISGIFGMR